MKVCYQQCSYDARATHRCCIAATRICVSHLAMTIETSIRPLKVAIVGGGPGGLATAIALSRIQNVAVKIYEQARILREVGAGISIGQNTWNVLELLGVADTLTSGHVIQAHLQL